MSAVLSRTAPVSLAGAVCAVGLAVGLVLNPGLGLVAVGVIAAVAFTGGRPRMLALGIFAATLAIDNPQEMPADGKWESPLADVGSLLFENLNKSFGLEGLHVSLLDVTIVVIAGMAWAAEETHPLRCPPLRDLCVLAALSVMAMEAGGLMRGGDFRQSLWQLRQGMAGPVLALVFAAEFDLLRDRILLGVLILVAAAVKLGLGLYVYEVVFRPLNERPAYTTTHSDSVLFTAALVLVIAFALSRRTWGASAMAAVVAPLTALAITINNRRIAWVEVALTLLVLYVAMPHNRWKRLATRAMLLALPIAALYTAAGWNSTSRAFLPVQVARTLGDSSRDRSSATRDIENYNLVHTLKENPLFGVGFGHEYIELSKADDISTYFPQYRFIPHNSLLGLWAFGGVIGFTLIWLPLIAGIYLAARSLRLAQTSLDRTAASAVVAVLVAYTVQCWGDMGFQSWPATLLAAAALAVAGQLAVAVGAWPRTTVAR